MLLAIDIGNTETVVGLYEAERAEDCLAEDGLVQHWRLSTVQERTPDEIVVLLRSLLDSEGVDMEADLTGVAVCSGVPRMRESMRIMVQRFFDFSSVVIEPGTRSGIPILYDNPHEVGADRIANAVAANHLYGGPAVVVDFGTTNNFDVISQDGEFLGGAIGPGIEVSLDAMVGRAAALGPVALIEPRNVIAKTTTESIQSGVIYGFASQIDGMVSRFEAELGQELIVIATGGLAHLIAPLSQTIQHVEPYLTLHGLWLVHKRNRQFVR
ncbi:MAG: type III pantothenate kinase [Acidimicrobiia bacterium]|nr:type III pantothenate kinase [Acidimicrobiia bacterium]MYC57045.1 type III pantothenate kinase [Acidimicrobiia bacterium]MYG93552.1 type III pantothenate kinase [Acidimicrobiia bacterium]MYI31114.1 type III pantothenate kinase [Acidimicrobiia bacterium]